MRLTGSADNPVGFCQRDKRSASDVCVRRTGWNRYSCPQNAGSVPLIPQYHSRDTEDLVSGLMPFGRGVRRGRACRGPGICGADRDLARGPEGGRACAFSAAAGGLQSAPLSSRAPPQAGPRRGSLLHADMGLVLDAY